MSIDLSLYEEVRLSGTFDLESITAENAAEYQRRLDELIVALDDVTEEELPNLPWILCWTLCFNAYLECLRTHGYGIGYAICVSKYNNCIDNCGPIQA